MAIGMDVSLSFNFATLRRSLRVKPLYCANVLQLSTSPDFRPVVSHWTRCADEPCVKESGTTVPRDDCCKRSSPIACAVATADSRSPFSRNWRLRS